MTSTPRDEVVRDIKGVKWYNEQGELHREDGPAAEWEDGTKHWLIHGKKHRIDGPASEWGSSSHQWYINGDYLSANQICDHLRKMITAELNAMSIFWIRLPSEDWRLESTLWARFNDLVRKAQEMDAVIECVDAMKASFRDSTTQQMLSWYHVETALE